MQHQRKRHFSPFRLPQRMFNYKFLPRFFTTINNDTDTDPRGSDALQKLRYFKKILFHFFPHFEPDSVVLCRVSTSNDVCECGKSGGRAKCRVILYSPR